MGLSEKCDDRASGRLDCDLTSERKRNTREREEVRVRGVAKEWFEGGELGIDEPERQLKERSEE